MADFPFALANGNTQFRQVIDTGKTSQISAMSLNPRETAMAGSAHDEHYIIVSGELANGEHPLRAPSILSIEAGTTRELAAGENGAKLVRIGDQQADAGSFAPDRQSASAQTLERVYAREFTIAQRKEAAASGAAMKDGTFVIHNGHDMDTAAGNLHHAEDPVKAKAHIKGRAKALGLSLPYGVRDTDSDGM